MTTSVCMGIYNGEKFIEKQLFSIFYQTKQPDEVILVDDGSIDRTVSIVKAFIEKYRLQNTWKLIINKENRGYPGNFYYAMSLCTQDLVFLADQDDIWDAGKLEEMCKIFDKFDTAKAVCCKFGLIDETEKTIHSVMQPSVSKGTDTIKEISIKGVFYKCEWPGMVLAYRRKWYEEKGKTESNAFKIPHDLLICALAAENQGFLQMDKELAWHRRHENNAGGEEHRLSKLLNKERKVKEITDYLEILNAFAESEVLQTAEGRAELQRKIASMQARYEALCSGKIGHVIRNAWQQRKDVRMATVLCDVLIVKG